MPEGSPGVWTRRTSSDSDRSERATPRQEHRDGLRQDEQVVRRGPVLDVEEIQPQVILEIEFAPSAHLPQAGDAGRDLEALHLPVLVPIDLVRQGWSRTHQAHLALQHVQELRELVEAEP